MKQKAFTLIELLVVIVIIGILATLSTATFSGSIKKARDAERQIFMSSAKDIILASQIAEDTADYRLGGTDLASIEQRYRELLSDQGLDTEAPSKWPYFVHLYSNDLGGSDPVDSFSVFSCREENAGKDDAPSNSSLTKEWFDYYFISSGEVENEVPGGVFFGLYDANLAEFCSDDNPFDTSETEPFSIGSGQNNFIAID